MMKKWSSAWAGLALSYGSIVIVIVLLICSFFYIYFSRSYNEELRNKNQLILENTARTIEETVLKRVQQLYVDLSLDKSADIRLFADQADRNGLNQVLDLQELLKAKVAANTDIVQGIHLYYPARNIMLSSLYGLRYNADQSEGLFIMRTGFRRCAPANITVSGRRHAKFQRISSPLRRARIPMACLRMRTATLSALQGKPVMSSLLLM